MLFDKRGPNGFLPLRGNTSKKKKIWFINGVEIM